MILKKIEYSRKKYVTLEFTINKIKGKSSQLCLQAMNKVGFSKLTFK